MLLLATTESLPNLSIFDPASPQAASIRTLAYLILAITAIIFLIVEVILVYSLRRFRQRSGDTAAEPAQVYGSMPIEIAWTAAPTLVVFVMTLVIARTLWEVKAHPDHPPAESKPLYVRVIGRQWWWEYIYETDDGQPLAFATANELHVPASDFSSPSTRRPVYLKLQSDDVCHSFWVPRLGGKTDLIPGRTNHMWFETDQPGLFLGQCAEFCGTQHAHMLLRVEVQSPSDFARWLEEQQQPAVDDPAVSAGKQAFLSHSCVNCHRIRGTSANGAYAPDLTHLMSRQTLASGILANSKENLRRWIANPQDIKPGCLMPAFGLSAHELDLIVDYLATLR